jgi:hypothetical protein
MLRVAQYDIDEISRIATKPRRGRACREPFEGVEEGVRTIGTSGTTGTTKVRAGNFS